MSTYSLSWNKIGLFKTPVKCCPRLCIALLNATSRLLLSLVQDVTGTKQTFWRYFTWHEDMKTLIQVRETVRNLLVSGVWCTLRCWTLQAKSSSAMWTTRGQGWLRCCSMFIYFDIIHWTNAVKYETSRTKTMRNISVGWLQMAYQSTTVQLLQYWSPARWHVNTGPLNSGAIVWIHHVLPEALFRV